MIRRGTPAALNGRSFWKIFWSLCDLLAYVIRHILIKLAGRRSSALAQSVLGAALLAKPAAAGEGRAIIVVS